MSTRNSGIAILILATGAAAPALAASLSFPSEPQPTPESGTLAPAPLLDNWSPGSATLVPLMAADTQATPATQVDPPAAGTSQPTGKPLDDISFVKRATESGRKEVAAARNALPQLKRPELKQHGGNAGAGPHQRQCEAVENCGGQGLAAARPAGRCAPAVGHRRAVTSMTSGPPR